MGKFSTTTIYEPFEKVKDVLLAKLQDHPHVYNLDGNGGGMVDMIDWIIEEPAYQGDAWRVTMKGQINQLDIQRFNNF